METCVFCWHEQHQQNSEQIFSEKLRVPSLDELLLIPEPDTPEWWEEIIPKQLRNPPLDELLLIRQPDVPECWSEQQNSKTANFFLKNTQIHRSMGRATFDQRARHSRMWAGTANQLNTNFRRMSPTNHRSMSSLHLIRQPDTPECRQEQQNS